MYLALKGLSSSISVSIVHPQHPGPSWCFSTSQSDCAHTTGPFLGKFFTLKEVYEHVEPSYQGRYTVPVLFDTKLNKIVNNESSEIIRMLNSEFNQELAQNKDLDLYPEKLRKDIDQINEWVYDQVNNGVYKTGFATSQEACERKLFVFLCQYFFVSLLHFFFVSDEKNFDNLFAALDKLEGMVSKTRFLCGDNLTEADVRLFTTLIRFDLVYYIHFKCCLRTIQYGYPNLFEYVKEIYQIPGVKDTVDFTHICEHYYWSHTSINPHRIVPKGPKIPNYEAPILKRPVKVVTISSSE